MFRLAKNNETVFFIWAASYTEVSRIAVLVALQPLLTLIFASAVSAWRPGYLKEETDYPKIIQKAAAIVFVVVGVVCLS